MIPNFWYAILESRKVRNKPVSIKRMGEDLVLWREPNGNLICMIDRCPHRGAALSLGRVNNGCIECPYHGFQYDAQGQCKLMPCNGKEAKIPPGFDVKTFPTCESQGFIWIWWGENRSQLPDLRWFEELPNSLIYTAQASQVWDVNYARIMESNFDIYHVPFVHRSLNFGFGTVVDSYHVEAKGDFICTWGRLRRDDGKSPEKSFGIPFKISAIFPQLTLIELTPKLRGIVLVTPIDEDNSWIAVRYYQDYVRVPLLGRFVAWLLLMVELKVVQEQQDLPILRSLKPKHTAIGVNRLVAADAGSAHYLKRWETLLHQ